jgi:hypothetical protein
MTHYIIERKEENGKYVEESEEEVVAVVVVGGIEIGDDGRRHRYGSSVASSLHLNRIKKSR